LADATGAGSSAELARRLRPRTEFRLMVSGLVGRAEGTAADETGPAGTGSLGVRRFEMESGPVGWPAADVRDSGAERTVLGRSWGFGGVDGSSEVASGWEMWLKVGSSVGSSAARTAGR